MRTSAMAQEQRKHDVFISYSSKDKKVADAIVAEKSVLS
jgi:hypothetical protein